MSEMPIRFLKNPQDVQTKKANGCLTENQKVRPQKNQPPNIASTNREIKNLCTNQNQNQIDLDSEKEPEGRKVGNSQQG